MLLSLLWPDPDIAIGDTNWCIYSVNLSCDAYKEVLLEAEGNISFTGSSREEVLMSTSTAKLGNILLVFAALLLVYIIDEVARFGFVTSPVPNKALTIPSDGLGINC